MNVTATSESSSGRTVIKGPGARTTKPGAKVSLYTTPRMASLYWQGVAEACGGGPCLPPPRGTLGAPVNEPERVAWFDGWQDGNAGLATQGR